MAKYQQDKKQCVDPFILAKILTLPGKEFSVELNEDDSGKESLVVLGKEWDPTEKAYLFHYVSDTFKSC